MFQGSFKAAVELTFAKKRGGSGGEGPCFTQKYFCANSWLIRWEFRDRNVSLSLFPSLPPPHLQHLKGILASRTQASSFHLLLPHQGFCFTLEAACGCTRKRVPTTAF